MKKQIIIVVLGIILFALTVNAESMLTPLTQGEIIALSKPAIVKIYHQVGGRLSMPAIKLDVTTMTLSVDSNSNVTKNDPTYSASTNSVILYKFDYTIDPQTIYGTGFVVNSDGYIVTNAHVASDDFMEKDYLKAIETSLVDDMIGAYDTKYPGKIDEMYPTDEEWTGIYDKLDVDMLKLVTDNAKFNSQLVVIPQSSADTTLEDILRDGFSAKVVSMMDDLFNEKNQDKDLALIKIEQTNLPSLKIDTTNSTQIGQKIFIWGFPSSAEFNIKDVINPTFTQGIVSAFKDSSDKSFKLLQTDAKISEGSSGSPILNEKGEVVGIVTYASDSVAMGDSFGWGIPSSLVLQVMKNGSVSNNSSYYENFSAGINLMKEKKCRSANDEFNAAKNTNDRFPVSQYVQPNIDTCASLISSGKSIDSIWAEIWVVVSEFFARFWALILVVITGIIALIFAIIMLVKQNKKEEADIEKIIAVNETQEKEIQDLKNQPK